MAIFEFPGSPKDLILPFEDMVLDGRPKTVSKYNVSNPHPGFGKDPNILNEYGHTKYPMWVGNKKAYNEEEEKALRNPTSVPEVKPDVPAPASNPWPVAK